MLDFLTGSISVYKKPPPKNDLAAAQSQSVRASSSSKVMSSLKRSVSDSDASSKSNVTCEHLAHVVRKPRISLDDSSWEPKFTVPGTVNWQLRDVQNDENLFYLVLPADYDVKDSDAEVVSMMRLKDGSISYRHLNSAMLGAIDESESASAGADANFFRGDATKMKSMESDVSVSSTSSSSSRFQRPSFGKSKRSRTGEQEKVFQFRVLLDGNEKFIWLQAAAELGRLNNVSAVKAVSSTMAKKLFHLPSIGSKTNKLTSLRYAEWACLIDQKKSVTKFEFDIHDVSKLKDPQDASEDKYNSTKLVKVQPTYAYRNRRMTEKDLYNDMATSSEKWEDFRQDASLDRDEKPIGSAHVEVLACHGLPKLDKFTATDAVCYFVCGPFAFATDVIDGFMSPVWPSKSRRACIFPIFHAYQKLFVGVFDDDGAAANDDFAGRAVIDLARLRPNSVYDIFLPLRMYRNMYIREPRGVIRLRIRLEWDDEKQALLSYLKRPTKTELLGNAVTVNCADLKAFRNVVFTVQGKDVPGRFKQTVMKGLQREMKLYKTIMKTSMKELMKDIVMWKVPRLSFCIFLAWMHCVYQNSFKFVPVYSTLAIIALLIRNYFEYGINDEFNFGFSPITLSETVRVLLYGGPGTKYIKPIKVERKADSTTKGSTSEDELDNDVLEDMFSNTGNNKFRMDSDHLEFPFSESGRYSKKTLSEACVDSSAILADDDDDENGLGRSGKLASLRKSAKIGGRKNSRTKARRDDDDDDDEDEFGLMVKSSVAHPENDANIPQTPPRNGPSSLNTNGGNTLTKKSSGVLVVDTSKDELPVWKRVTDPRGLPEQDASVSVKSRKTLKEEIIHNKNLLHKMSMRMFDDRTYVLHRDDPIGEELALINAIGMNKHKNPMIAKIAEYVAPGLEGLKVGLSVWRAAFNLFTWRDPFLTSLFFFGILSVLCVLLIFPWRLFFFAAGLGAVGPQNYALRLAGVFDKKKKVKDSAEVDIPKRAGSRRSTVDSLDSTTRKFTFHNHLLTNNGNDARGGKEEKRSKQIAHRAVVPNSPLISRRFYDWPPNPSLSTVDPFEG